jgi:hypothetical protein
LSSVSCGVCWEDIVVAVIEVDEIGGYEKKEKLQIETVETENFIRKDRNVLVVRKTCEKNPSLGLDQICNSRLGRARFTSVRQHYSTSETLPFLKLTFRSLYL